MTALAKSSGFARYKILRSFVDQRSTRSRALVMLVMPVKQCKQLKRHFHGRDELVGKVEEKKSYFAQGKLAEKKKQ